MKVSIFTPFSESGNRYIRETYESLRAQTIVDWEWVTLINNGGRLPVEIEQDSRVKAIVARRELKGVGALKREACSLCSGDILLELDHDDLLAPRALARLVETFSGAEGADFVYSDFAEFKDGTWEPNTYSAQYGWLRYPTQYMGHELIAMVAPEDPVAWRRIEWAPNHLRAWRREFYDRIGGHDPELFFADDHDLVLRSLLAGGKCLRIPECLYFYRVHGSQNVKTNNAKIQALEAGVYNRTIYRLAENIADKRDLRAVDLCGGHDSPDNYVPIDLIAPPRGLQADLNKRWPLADDSVGVIRAFDAIEHLRDPIHTMNEAWRVLAPGGFLLVLVPSTDAIVEDLGDGRSNLINGSGAYCDPTHVSFWNQMSFRYYTDNRWRKYLAGIEARFQIARLETVNANGVPYVRAELIALKPGYSPMGEVRC